MSHFSFLHNSIKYKLSLIAMFVVLIANGQTPTHIDPGASDESISIFDEPRYLLLIIALIVILVVFYIALKRRGKE